MNRALAAALTAAAVLWAVAIFTLPAALTSTSLRAPAAVFYAIGSRICHQRAERSFSIDAVQLPVCARCTGLYLSAAGGALAVWLLGRRYERVSARRALLIAAIPTAVTWLLEHLGGVPFSNSVRAIAALPLGAAAGWLLVRLLRYDSRLDGEQILYS